MTFSATPATYRLAPPELDEHGDDIRAWLSSPAGSSGSAGSAGSKGSEESAGSAEEGTE